MKIKSHAKINLFLHIIGKRPDNYHLLESIFYFPEIYDEIEIIEGKGAKNLEISGRFADKLVGDENNNLILKTYSLLKILYSTKLPDLHFKLKKNLPVAAGIGGGSANAATTLKALNEIYKLGLSDAALYKIGARLGADVPACILGRTCFVEGIGEKLSDISNFPKLNILLVNPLVPVSTAEIFKMGFGNYSASLGTNPQSLSFKSTQHLIDFLENTKNNLENNAIKLCPQISDIIKNISSQNGCFLARMSGSGATCFGIFESADKAKQAKLVIETQNPNFWCEVG
jgi:4-diphosphocytidyl-2-C-methyl-D-erythritol kinase